MIDVVLLAACDRARAIGFDNRLLWHLPDDLKRFKALTTGKTVLMGRKTAESLGRALPDRVNLVLSRSGRVPFEGMQAVDSLSQATKVCTGAELMVIGGGEIYALALPFAQRMHLTHVDVLMPQADAYFPEFTAEHWRKTTEQVHAADQRHPLAFRFCDYERINPSI